MSHGLACGTIFSPVKPCTATGILVPMVVLPGNYRCSIGLLGPQWVVRLAWGFVSIAGERVSLIILLMSAYPIWVESLTTSDVKSALYSKDHEDK